MQKKKGIVFIVLTIIICVSMSCCTKISNTELEKGQQLTDGTTETTKDELCTDKEESGKVATESTEIGAIDSEPAETEPTKPAETESTKPAETESTKPAETESTKPAETESTEPVETDPTEPIQTETNPSEVPGSEDVGGDENVGGDGGMRQ